MKPDWKLKDGEWALKKKSAKKSQDQKLLFKQIKIGKFLC